MDIRRTILWMIFSFSLLLLWNNWQVHNGNPSLFGSGTQSQVSTDVASADTTGDSSVPTGVPATPTTQASPPIDQLQPVEAEAVSQPVNVSTDVFELTFDTLGAQLVKTQLNRYTATNAADQPMILMDKTANYTYVAQTGIVGAPAGQAYPTHLTPYQLVSVDENPGGTTDIIFQAESDNVRVVKTYTVTNDEYAIKVKHDVYNLGDAPIDPSLYLQLTRDDSTPPNTSGFYSTYTGPALYSEEEKFQKVKFSDIDKGKTSYTRQADNGWIGMVQHYFAAAWIPQQGVARTNEVLPLGNDLYAIRTIESVGTIQPGGVQSVTSDLWVGPQDQGAMSELAPGLELVVDYGWLTIISKPLFILMTWLHTFLNNWGWTIVVLTLLIKLVFYPLSAASYRSMAKMKLVAPRLKALREQFGDDKAKLNSAMMEMYRTEKINPLGGCLPMLVQIPVFIALYWVLLGSVEMRGAPWILWIQDLSARDPWFILPAVMMATMFLQIKLNPTPPDPMQARIMMLMPLIFGGMMFFFPAGLVLYWLVNNILSIAQQRFVMHQIDKAEAAAKR